jgi:hypothetical protein
VFSSPLRLDLRLRLTDRTSATEMLDVWPPFFIEIDSSFNLGDNIMAALEHHDRICDIRLRVTDSDYERLATVMQKPFPALTNLDLSSYSNVHALVLPDTFLRDSAPRLRSLTLTSIPFPALPQLLLSCNDLSELRLLYTPNFGHISPEAIVTGLSALPRLTYFQIEFRSSQTIRLLPPLTLSVARTLLPALTEFEFFGGSEYLEDLMARIDTPQLKILTAFYDLQVSDIRVPQLMFHLETLGPFDRADVTFGTYSVSIRLYQSQETEPPQMLELGILQSIPGQLISSMAQIFLSSFLLLSRVTGLEIRNHSDQMDNPEWLVLLRPFSAVRTLRLSSRLPPFIVSSLLGHTSVAEVLPELQSLYLHGGHWQDSVNSQAIEQFLTARQNSDRPVTVHCLPDNASDSDSD